MKATTQGTDMRYERFSFGSIKIDGVIHEHDVVIDRGEIRKRKKKPSKQFRDQFGHTPVSMEEKIPWKCRLLVIGIIRKVAGHGSGETRGGAPQN